MYKYRDLELKKFIFPGTTLIVSFYLSVLFTIGIIAGYLGTNLFCKKLIKTGKVRRVVLPLGKWEIHFHHSLLGGMGIIIVYFLSSLSIFWLGIFGGLIFHDIYSDKEWYKIIYRKNI